MARELDVEVRALELGKKIHALRTWRNMTLQQVSDLTGLSKPLLSQIENNATAPPIGTLLKIARALGVNISYFFQEGTSKQPDIQVQRKDHKDLLARLQQMSLNTGYSYESLVDSRTKKQMEPFIVEIKPLSDEELVFYSHPGQVYLYVLEEYVEFRQTTFVTTERLVFPFLFVLEEPVDLRGSHKTVTLGPGDSLYFDSEIPHALSGLSGKTARALVVVHSSA